MLDRGPATAMVSRIGFLADTDCKITLVEKGMGLKREENTTVEMFMYPFKVLTNKIDSFLDHFFCSNPVSNIIYYLEKKSETLETCQLSGFFFTTGEIFEKCNWVLFSQVGVLP